MTAYVMWCTASHGHQPTEHERGNFVLYADWDDMRNKYEALRRAPPTTNNVEPRELASGHFHVWKEKWKDGSMIGQECFCGAERDVKQSAQNDTAKPAGDGGITKLYHELLYQVATKHPGETRHETALRYIRNAERGSNQTQASQSGDEQPGGAVDRTATRKEQGD